MIPLGEGRYEWMDNAACSGHSEKMFPRWHKDISYIPDARALCRGCPVKDPCLEYALEFPPSDMHGVWAGKTPRQLAAEQKRRGISATRPTIAQMMSAFLPE
jgi:WhiB family redox-sensing transcriptional regulator